ncbi:MHO_1580 family protein [Mycoplasmopsis sturni]|uniref:MHO_1580 family protein n=1 Tax=Mycoplasmopsis sturni TaxID=39047 RepID=UPI00055E34F2|nr:hypothetical protein [Mycoplasmopsis sturni]
MIIHNYYQSSIYYLDNSQIDTKWLNKNLPANFKVHFSIEKLFSNGYFNLYFSSNLANKRWSVSLLINDKIVIEKIDRHLNYFKLEFKDINLEYSKIKNINLIFYDSNEIIQGQMILRFDTFKKAQKNFKVLNDQAIVKVPQIYEFILLSNKIESIKSFFNIKIRLNELSNNKGISKLGEFILYSDLENNEGEEVFYPILEEAQLELSQFLNKPLRLLVNKTPGKENFYDLIFNHDILVLDEKIELSNSDNSRKELILPPLFSGVLDETISLSFDDFKLNFVKEFKLSVNENFNLRKIRKLKITEIPFYQSFNAKLVLDLSKIFDLSLQSKINNFASMVIYATKKDEMNP